VQAVVTPDGQQKSTAPTDTETETATGVTLDPEIERRKQEAEAERAIAEARRAIADADRARLTALIPDLTSVSREETTLTTQEPVVSSVLAHRALRDAATSVYDQVKDFLGDEGIILLTSDADLATSDAAHAEVKAGIDQLIAAADKLLLEVPEVEKAPKAEVPTKETPLAPLGALAAAIPSVLSLMSAHRSISTHAASIDDTAALAAVAGTLSDAKVQLDDFRLVPKGDIADHASRLQEQRSQLLARKIRREQTKAQSGMRRGVSEERIRELNTQLDRAREKGGELPKDILKEIKEEKDQRDAASLAEKEAAVQAQVVDSALTIIDAFLTRLTMVPAGARRSPLAAAALREQLHKTVDPRVSRVLLIKAAAGSVAQLLNDRPLWFEDKFSMIGSVSLSYVLIDTSDSLVKVAGQASGSANIAGSIGKDFSLTAGPF
jgi:hypothetical protein